MARNHTTQRTTQTEMHSTLRGSVGHMAACTASLALRTTKRILTTGVQMDECRWNTTLRMTFAHTQNCCFSKSYQGEAHTKKNTTTMTEPQANSSNLCGPSVWPLATYTLNLAFVGPARTWRLPLFDKDKSFLCR